MRYSDILGILALTSSIAHGFTPSHVTELLLWATYILLVKERNDSIRRAR